MKQMCIMSSHLTHHINFTLLIPLNPIIFKYKTLGTDTLVYITKAEEIVAFSACLLGRNFWISIQTLLQLQAKCKQRCKVCFCFIFLTRSNFAGKKSISVWRCDCRLPISSISMWRCDCRLPISSISVWRCDCRLPISKERNELVSWGLFTINA